MYTSTNTYHHPLNVHDMPTPSVHQQTPPPTLTTHAEVLQGEPLSTTLFASSFTILLDLSWHNLEQFHPECLQHVISSNFLLHATER
eukprot:2470020-Amphidinium_carterae.1